MYDHSKYLAVRPEILDSLDRYAQSKIPTGSFLEAVLNNDLMEAMGRADNGNRETLFEICSYVYNELPASCHGTPLRVRQWLQPKKVKSDAQET